MTFFFFFFLYIHDWSMEVVWECLTYWNNSVMNLAQTYRDHVFHMGEWGPLHTRDWEPEPITLQALSLMEKAEPVQVRFTLLLRDQRSMWMQDGCEVYVDSYMASNGSCFMVTWIILKNHILDVGLTQNWETRTLQTLTTVDLFYCIMCEDPHE